jgi:hypothetical protein
LFLLLARSAAKAADTTINGWISDAMCGAKHAGTGAACAKKCIAGGEAPVFVDEAKKEVWTIDNPDAVKAFYGDHVTVTATADARRRACTSTRLPKRSRASAAISRQLDSPRRCNLW